MMRKPTVAIDFDGTCVKHAFPGIGDDIGAVVPLKGIAERCKIILLTMRHGERLEEAVQWFEASGIDLWQVNSNPSQGAWTQSPKVYAHLYIDDAALGIPLFGEPGERPYVDWNAAWPMFLGWFDRWVAANKGKKR